MTLFFVFDPLSHVLAEFPQHAARNIRFPDVLSIAFNHGNRALPVKDPGLAVLNGVNGPDRWRESACDKLPTLAAIRSMDDVYGPGAVTRSTYPPTLIAAREVEGTPLVGWRRLCRSPTRAVRASVKNILIEESQAIVMKAP